jgi:hypothetical protein
LRQFSNSRFPAMAPHWESFQEGELIVRNVFWSEKSKLKMNPPVNQIPLGNRIVYWKVNNARMSRNEQMN